MYHQPRVHSLLEHTEYDSVVTPHDTTDMVSYQQKKNSATYFLKSELYTTVIKPFPGCLILISFSFLFYCREEIISDTIII